MKKGNPYRLSSYSSYRKRNKAYSYVFTLVRYIIVVAVVVGMLRFFLLGSFAIETTAMRPQLDPGDRVVTSPFVFGARYGDNRSLPGIRSPQYGDVVVLNSPYKPQTSVFLRVLDAPIRFFTAQQVSLLPKPHGTEARDVIRRVAALPGDTVRVERYIVYVRRSGETAFRSEFDLSARTYQLRADPLPQNWTARSPFSDAFSEYTLGPDEYFVVGDNRTEALDSRYWGPVGSHEITAKVLLRYWPLRRFSRL
ncbi:MAG: signal peptidase I [Spirochaetaceae bacterium]|nr:MAG: signal peptidase I [Spirochaetaceae bacterium]